MPTFLTEVRETLVAHLRQLTPATLFGKGKGEASIRVIDAPLVQAVARRSLRQMQGWLAVDALGPVRCVGAVDASVQ